MTSHAHDSSALAMPAALLFDGFPDAPCAPMSDFVATRADALAALRRAATEYLRVTDTAVTTPSWSPDGDCAWATTVSRLDSADLLALAADTIAARATPLLDEAEDDEARQRQVQGNRLLVDVFETMQAALPTASLERAGSAFALLKRTHLWADAAREAILVASDVDPVQMEALASRLDDAKDAVASALGAGLPVREINVRMGQEAAAWAALALLVRQLAHNDVILTLYEPFGAIISMNGLLATMHRRAA